MNIGRKPTEEELKRLGEVKAEKDTMLNELRRMEVGDYLVYGWGAYNDVLAMTKILQGTFFKVDVVAGTTPPYNKVFVQRQ